MPLSDFYIYHVAHKGYPLFSFLHSSNNNIPPRFRLSHNNMGSLTAALGNLSLTASLGDLSILPGETRTKIYSYLLDAEYVDVSKEGELEFHPAILRVNRTINGETSPMIHQGNKFIKLKFPRDAYWQKYFPITHIEPEYCNPPEILRYCHNPLFLYTKPSHQATTLSMRHNVMRMDLTNIDFTRNLLVPTALPDTIVESSRVLDVSLQQEDEVKVAQDDIEHTHIVFPLALLPHLTHHLSSYALCTSPGVFALTLWIGQSYNDTISHEICKELLEPAHIFQKTQVIRIDTASYLEDTVRNLVSLNIPANLDYFKFFDKILLGWLERHEQLVEQAKALWKEGDYNKAVELAWYASSAIGLVQTWYMGSPHRRSLGEQGRDLFGIAANGIRDPHWTWRKRMENVLVECRTMDKAWVEMFEEEGEGEGDEGEAPLTQE